MYICQNLEGAKVQLFEAKKKKVYYFLFILPKVAPLHPEFSLSTFLQIKAIKLPRTPSNKDSAKVRENHSRSQQGCKLQMPQLHKLCLHAETCTFIFVLGGQGGDVGPVPCSLCQLGNARGGVFRPFTFLGQGEQPAITKGLFSWT